MGTTTIINHFIIGSRDKGTSTNSMEKGNQLLLPRSVLNYWMILVLYGNQSQKTMGYQKTLRNKCIGRNIDNNLSITRTQMMEIPTCQKIIHRIKYLEIGLQINDIITDSF